jgi:hypothetical protein
MRPLFHSFAAALGARLMTAPLVFAQSSFTGRNDRLRNIDRNDRGGDDYDRANEPRRHWRTTTGNYGARIVNPKRHRPHTGADPRPVLQLSLEYWHTRNNWLDRPRNT